MVRYSSEEVERFWTNRDRYGTGRSTVYAYGIGSWVLGKEEVVEGTRQAESGPRSQGSGKPATRKTRTPMAAETSVKRATTKKARRSRGIPDRWEKRAGSVAQRREGHRAMASSTPP